MKPNKHQKINSEEEAHAEEAMHAEKAINAAFEQFARDHAADAYTAAMKPSPIEEVVRATIPIEMGYFNLKPECAMIGNTILCTHFQDVSLLKLATTRVLTVERRSIQQHGYYKIAACKSKNVFFVATDVSILAVDLDGNIVGSPQNCAPRGLRYSPNLKVPLSLACDDKVSVIHTDNEHHVTLTLLEWNAASGFTITGQLRMTMPTFKIDVIRHEAMKNEEWEIHSSSARLLSPLQFTALHGRDNVPTLFQIDIDDIDASGAMQPRPVREVGLPVYFRCFANLESATQPAFGVCALLEDAPVRDQPPLLRFFENLTPIFETKMWGISVALCSGDEKDTFQVVQVVEHNAEFYLTFGQFKWVGFKSSNRALNAALAMMLARGQTNPAEVCRRIYKANIYPTSEKPIPGMHAKQGGSRKKRKIVKRKVRKSRKH
jgi:hypothetical protein